MRARWYRLARPDRKVGGLAEAAVAVVAAALYARTIGFGLVFDDHSLLGPDGPRFLGGEWIPYRPLRYASLWLDYWLGGGAPWAAHATNVVLHAGTSALVAGLGRRAGAPVWAAVACALVIAVHPLAVESVAYVSGRRDMLATMLGLAAIAAWASPQGRSAWSVVAVLLAVAAKESSILFVAVLALASACGIGPPLASIRRTLAFAALAAIALPVAYGATGPLVPRGEVATKLVVAGALSAHYGERLVAPTGLSVEYPELRCRSDECRRLAGPRSWAGLALLGTVVASAGALLVARRRPATAISGWRAFTLSWLALWLLAVVFAIGTHEPGADRHAYPLLAAAAVALAAFLAPLPSGARTVAATLLVIWSVLAAGRADARIDVWRNDLTLWSSAVRDAASSARAHHNLAAALAERNRYAKARRHLERALTLDPAYWPSELGLAAIDCEKGRLASGGAHLSRAHAAGARGDELAAAMRRCQRRAAGDGS